MIRVQTVLTCMAAVVTLGIGPASASLEHSHLSTGAGDPGRTTQTEATAVPWTLSYDSWTRVVTLTIDGTKWRCAAPLAATNGAFVRVTAANSEILRCNAAALANGVVLSGNTVIHPAVDGPIQIEVGSKDTAYVAPTTWSQLKVLFKTE